MMGRSAAAMLGLLIGFGPVAVCTGDGGGLEVGDTLGTDNWQLARDLLPPEILKHYETGRYRNRIVDYPRVRQVSPANRSDGYLGSDLSGDDGFFFDGKPEDFTWRLIGRRDARRRSCAVGRSAAISSIRRRWCVMASERRMRRAMDHGC